MKSFSFKISGNPYQVRILNVEESFAEVEVNGTRYEVQLEKPPKRTKTPKLVRGKTPAHTGPHRAMMGPPKSRVEAPLPGTITELMVKPGDVVKREQVLILMEAMKMENRVLAEAEGRVKNILVKEGDAVLQGQPLIEME